MGAGPAGMEVAIRTARRGHRVTLLEQGPTVGGQLRAASVPRYKRREFLHLISYYQVQLKKAGVRLLLGTEATPQTVEAQRPDAVVIATGARQQLPRIPGDGAQIVWGALEILLHRPTALGRTVVVLGGQQVGLDTALWLAEDGRLITVVEPSGGIAEDANESIRRDLLQRAAERGLRLLVRHTIVAVTDRGVLLRANDQMLRVDAESIVAASGFQPYDPISAALAGRVPEIRTIGSAARLGRLHEATADALRVAS